MDTKRQGFWKKFSKKMTSTQHREDPMDLCLNKALLDLYKVKDNNGGQKEVNRYAGYVLHFVVLLDTIAMKGSDYNLNYSMDDPNLFDPLDKSVILSGAASLRGIAQTFRLQKNVHNRGDPDRYEWESLDYTASRETCHMLELALTRVLRYLKLNTDLTQHVDIFMAENPPHDTY
jgi:hypothetical protein